MNIKKILHQLNNKVSEFVQSLTWDNFYAKSNKTLKYFKRGCSRIWRDLTLKNIFFSLCNGFAFILTGFAFQNSLSAIHHLLRLPFPKQMLDILLIYTPSILFELKTRLFGERIATFKLGNHGVHLEKVKETVGLFSIEYRLTLSELSNHLNQQIETAKGNQLYWDKEAQKDEQTPKQREDAAFFDASKPLPHEIRCLLQSQHNHPISPSCASVSDANAQIADEAIPQHRLIEALIFSTVESNPNLFYPSEAQYVKQHYHKANDKYNTWKNANQIKP